MRIFIGLFLLLIACGCKEQQTSFRDEGELLTYVNDPDNGYISVDENGDFKMEAKLIPAIKGDKSPQFTIQVRLSRMDGLPVLEYGNVLHDIALEREGYLSFEVLKDVYLECGDNSKPAIFSHYERNYGLKPSVDLFFRFNQFNPQEDITFVYRDQLFGQGMFRIKFNKILFTSCHVQN